MSQNQHERQKRLKMRDLGMLMKRGAGGTKHLAAVEAFGDSQRRFQA